MKLLAIIVVILFVAFLSAGIIYPQWDVELPLKGLGLHFRTIPK